LPASTIQLLSYTSCRDKLTNSKPHYNLHLTAQLHHSATNPPSNTPKAQSSSPSFAQSATTTTPTPNCQTSSHIALLPTLLLSLAITSINLPIVSTSQTTADI